ncbi:MAG: hypothetical protein BAJATHORv1_20055 [Candidatus Thorarchaeota archaeon]|nr:MAG: hypothetical protein BAJATHORv1_20055 [Candidatus Thorarchaeota archaeon]
MIEILIIATLFFALIIVAIYTGGTDRRGYHRPEEKDKHERDLKRHQEEERSRLDARYRPRG